MTTAEAASTGSRPGRRRAVRALQTLLAVLVALALVLFLTGAWYFSGEIRAGALEVRPQTPVERDLRILASAGDSLVLESTTDAPDALAQAKTYGLDWLSGYGQVGDVIADGDRVTHQLTVLSGDAPLPGQRAALRRDAFPDVRTAVGRGVRDVSYRSPAGTFPAWLSDGSSTTWAVLAHGRGATRTEMLRMMRTTAALGLPSLDITYRRDAENGGGLAQFGQDEWIDVEAAVQYALDEGAEQVVLVGASMGGGICAAFLERSELAHHVVALVLDAPMLDFDATIAHGAAQRRLPVLGLPLPGPLTWTARQIAGQRYGIDSSRVDYLDDTAWLTVPALVFHGTSDDTVPDTVASRLAAAEPLRAQHVSVEGAEHVESWNVDPASYDVAVRQFLQPLID